MDSKGYPTHNQCVDVVRGVGGSARSRTIGAGQWLPWALWSLTFVFAAASIAGAPPESPVDMVGDLAMAVGTMALATIGALVAVRAETRVPGWLLLVFAVPWAATWALYALVAALVTNTAIDLVRAQVMIGLADTAAISSMFGIFGAFLTVPDGRLPRRWGRPLAVSVVMFLVAWVGNTYFLAGQITDPLAYVNRASLASLEGADPTAAFEAITVGMTFVGLLLVIAIAVAMIDRYRSSDLEARQQLKWVLVGALSVLFWMALWVPQWTGNAGRTVQAILPGLGLISLASGFGFSMFKYRLWDVDVVIRRSLVYGTLWLAIATIYVAVAAGLGIMAGARFPVSVAIGLTVLATLVVQPARGRLERLANRLVFGRRPSPIAAIHEFGSSVGIRTRPRDIAHDLADLVKRVIGARAVEVAIDGTGPVVVGEWGSGAATAVELRWDEEVFGAIRCIPHRGETFDADEVTVVEALASQAALSISHARLAFRMVTAQESERRKIERNIHDGVQQDLAAQIGQLALARTRVGEDADLAVRLARIQRDMQRTLSEIRELAQGIHPSVLRDGGLLAAIEDKCAHLPLAVTIDAPTGFERLRFDDDLETAAYFTVSEAIANVIKHADATRISILLDWVDDDLSVELTDDGGGFDTQQASDGTGLGGLADRLRALGGELRIDSRLTVGTTVHATLPYAHPKEAS